MTISKVSKKDPVPMLQGLRDFQDGSTIRHCKIIGTLGPSSSDKKTIKALVEAGLDIARLNFSHGTHEAHLKNIQILREVMVETKRNVTILQDLQGPKIRCGLLKGGSMQLTEGETYSLQFGIEQNDPRIIPIDYPDLVRDVKVGESVMMNDGLLIFDVKTVQNNEVIVEVTAGGELKSRKGVNFPNSMLSIPAMTEKDNRDLLFGIANNVDVIALSFVQTPGDITATKKIINALGSDIPVIAKIEKYSAVMQIAEIARVADGLMVARGDLGVECKIERVPLYQRKIIAAAAVESKPVIIATQMLESMVNNPRASLAEMADVANGVLEGADCVMLSAEVASGKYPVECVKNMAEIIRDVESWRHTRTQRYFEADATENWEDHRAIARAACEAADVLKAKAIICLTLTGSIARLIASWRPQTPIIAISPRKEVISRLGFSWGVYGMQNPLFYNTDILLQDLPQLLKSLGIVQTGDVIVITAGIPIKSMSPTNMLKINRIK